MKTTIAITKEAKEKINQFGYKGETYSDILSRLIKSAEERQLQYLLMNETNTVSIEKALANAKETWQK